MKHTNEMNLPEPIANAVKNDPYDKGEDADYSVTELIDPPRKIALQRIHQEEITEDVADGIFRLLGQAVHTILERAGVPERRFAVTVLGKTITGKMDRYKDGLLQDWKVTSAYQFKGGKAPFNVECQLNCYAEILRQNGKKITRLEAVGILRDWSKLEVLRGGGDYPAHQVIVAQVPIWPEEHAKKFLEARVSLHEAAKIQLPQCTDGERWSRPDVFAVMKKDRERAVRLLATKQLAEDFISMQKDKTALLVVHRPGQNVRCESYCYAAPFCEQWKRIQEGLKAGPKIVPHSIPAAVPVQAVATGGAPSVTTLSAAELNPPIDRTAKRKAGGHKKRVRKPKPKTKKPFAEQWKTPDTRKRGLIPRPVLSLVKGKKP